MKEEMNFNQQEISEMRKIELIDIVGEYFQRFKDQTLIVEGYNETERDIKLNLLDPKQKYELLNRIADNIFEHGYFSKTEQFFIKNRLAFLLGGNIKHNQEIH